MMIVEQMLKNAPNQLLHIADVSGSALFQGDCLDIMPLIPDKSIQLILADLPYGETHCKWDTIIPFEPLWNEYKRILKDDGAIVLTATNPFAANLIMSNPEMFKYEWVWNKKLTGSPAVAKYRPLPIFENILVFGKGKTKYNPEMRTGKMRVKGRKTLGNTGEDISENWKGLKNGHFTENDQYYPTNILEIPNTNRTGKQHPTEKPLDLMLYLVKTYTDETDMVLDNTMGSGTTCLAAKELNRKFIGIEKEPKYYEIACQRCGF